MEMNIQVQCTTKPLDQRYSASAGCLSRIARFPGKMHGDDTINDTQHLTRDQRKAGEGKAQRGMGN